MRCTCLRLVLPDVNVWSIQSGWIILINEILRRIVYSDTGVGASEEVLEEGIHRLSSHKMITQRLANKL